MRFYAISNQFGNRTLTSFTGDFELIILNGKWLRFRLMAIIVPHKYGCYSFWVDGSESHKKFKTQAIDINDKKKRPSEKFHPLFLFLLTLKAIILGSDLFVCAHAPLYLRQFRTCSVKCTNLSIVSNTIKNSPYSTIYHAIDWQKGNFNTIFNRARKKNARICAKNFTHWTCHVNENSVQLNFRFDYANFVSKFAKKVQTKIGLMSVSNEVSVA